MNWDSVCQSKEDGGLGVRRLREFNLSLLGKSCWRSLVEKGGLWYRVLMARYGEGGRLKEGGRMVSSWWKSLAAIRDGIRWAWGVSLTITFLGIYVMVVVHIFGRINGLEICHLVIGSAAYSIWSITLCVRWLRCIIYGGMREERRGSVVEGCLRGRRTFLGTVVFCYIALLFRLISMIVGYGFSTRSKDI